MALFGLDEDSNERELRSPPAYGLGLRPFGRRLAAWEARPGPRLRAASNSFFRCFGGMRRQMSQAVRTRPTGPARRPSMKKGRRGMASFRT